MIQERKAMFDHGPFFYNKYKNMVNEIKAEDICCVISQRKQIVVSKKQKKPFLPGWSEAMGRDDIREISGK